MKIIELKELDWSFSQEYPTVEAGFAQQVDPIPCYPHDLVAVTKSVESAVAAFPIPESFGPDVYILSFEDKHRTNAWASSKADYSWEPKEGEDKKNRPWRGYFALNGKRTPIHTAVTRYAVPHEYGHIIAMWLNRQWGLQDEWQSDDKRELLKAYANERGAEYIEGYGPGKWHTNMGEIFANDFRILVCRAEVEFWPHPQLPHPDTLPVIKAWWEYQREKYAYRVSE